LKHLCKLLALLFLALALALGPKSAQAGGLVMSLDNVTGPMAGQGTFDVLLKNTELSGGQSFDVASFSFELVLPSASGVEFSAASTATVSNPYLFAGTGGASVDPSFTLSLDSFPNTDFAGSDTEFTFPSIAVAPGATFGLGLISYIVAPDAPSGAVQVSFVSFGTSLTDAASAPIAFQTDDSNGIIHVSGSAVPEPSSLMLTSIAFGTVLVMLRLHRC
jgi:hypothetical protein